MDMGAQLIIMGIFVMCLALVLRRVLKTLEPKPKLTLVCPPHKWDGVGRTLMCVHCGRIPGEETPDE